MNSLVSTIHSKGHHTRSAEIFYLKRAKSVSPVEDRLKVVAQFYGLELRLLEVISGRAGVEQLRAVKKDSLSALVIDANTLSAFDSDMMTAMFDILSSRHPTMIAGINATTDPKALARWSNGAVLSGTVIDGLCTAKFAGDSTLKPITRQLSGLTIAQPIRLATRLNISQHPGSLNPILNFISQGDSTNIPGFVLKTIGMRDVFFLGDYNIANNGIRNAKYMRAIIWEILPLMMFLRYFFEDRCWHSPGHYANFTIDDPWLIEPYGHFSNLGLLEQMRKVNFHTTIAFIPWNYNRSHSNVVKLFKENPDRFSISIHGNNHDWKEFEMDHPSPVQEANIKEAKVRMKRFTDITGIPHDRVFVFPRGDVPARIFPVLKRQNFLATVNFSNIPLGATAPTDLLFYLRPVSLDFGNFPSVKRYSPDSLSSAEIALQLFLDNPIIFYTHHNFFKTGIDAFNSVAITVNHIEPNLHWISLGKLAKQLYLERTIGKDEYEVIAFSPTIYLENPHPHPGRFTVRKQENFSIPIRCVKVDGIQYDRLPSQHEVLLSVYIQPGQGRTISIEYDEGVAEIDLPSVKIEWWIQIQRSLSDFRDLTLSRSTIGRVIIKLYASLKNSTFKLAILVISIVSIGVGFVVRYVRHRNVSR